MGRTWRKNSDYSYKRDARDQQRQLRKRNKKLQKQNKSEEGSVVDRKFKDYG
jgi:hypothetical protein